MENICAFIHSVQPFFFKDDTAAIFVKIFIACVFCLLYFQTYEYCPYLLTHAYCQYLSQLVYSSHVSQQNLTVVEVNKTESPLLVPYPDLETNTVGTVKWPPRLVSVTRVRADACDRLWVMDTGSVELLTSQHKQMVPPKIVVYNLKTDEPVFAFSLRDYKDGSLFPTITVDVTSANCNHAFAYLPDVMHSRLVVYSMDTNDTHVIEHNYFHFDPLAGDFHNGGLRWQWQVGQCY